MQIDTFKSIISTFADPGVDIIYDRQRVMFSINGSVIDAAISSRSGDIYIDEGTGFVHASKWIITRLANLPLLASRINEQIPIQENFVAPAADILPSLNASPDESKTKVENALTEILSTLSDRSPLETTVLYLTSDAGEGKTSLINKAAREQAKKFSSGDSDWLLVPIILGGRHFLRFDDITVGALQNKYRFPFLYYNSFLALVRMGVIVPAFDGFEEMFVENSSGEALSAMGILVSALQSTGAVVIAARKAYFEFENLRSQEKLYDTISQFDVGFSKLEINRWSKKQFLEYCVNRKISDGETIYNRVAERLGPNHSLLTRPVLVTRLLDIAGRSDSLESFIERIQSSGSDFFSVFVRGIIEREATEKWIDRSGDMGSNLLTVDEHCELLSLIAIGMWESRTEHLKKDHLEMIAEYFCESKRKTALQSQQVVDRIRGHALLISSPDTTAAVQFDHDEFRQFFLGDGLAAAVAPMDKSAVAETFGILRRGILPEHTQLSFIRAVKRRDETELSNLAAANFIAKVSALDGQASYTKENCGNLIVRLLSELDAEGTMFEEIVFGIDCLRDCKLAGVSFKNCHFSQGSYEATMIRSCSFENCTFGQIRFHPSTVFDNNHFENCTVDSIRIESTGVEIWEPNAINMFLATLGTTFETPIDVDLEILPPEVDENLVNIEKLLRYFMRSTHISESVIKIKLGDRGQSFIDYSLPDLLSRGIVVEIDNRGSGQQRRFKLGKQLQQLNGKLSEAKGSYTAFLQSYESSRDD
ncbi:pentapeptide repeat-containing protein [Pseudomonas sp. TNT2022 ID642]|uniref:pentapeptide repeat-containing protein n=1 Tax=Pseudomonas sp. TNT2022 ID642 TaxID=2942632 RepID=UPI0023618A28|nr:pentapeptide repeat-containing protein [Pseudomonas sp. TNT2022 ID642]MDD1002132.1 pentapeptide repeat-containing protein [Pseudomonas sp. TNT2022 ID642]